MSIFNLLEVALIGGLLQRSRYQQQLQMQQRYYKGFSSEELE
jgi:hypothetical protein